MHQRINPSPPAGPTQRRTRLLLIGAICAGVFGGGALVLLTYNAVADSVSASRAICDRVVGTLLTTRDPVELQRAAALVHTLECNVARRMRAQP